MTRKPIFDAIKTVRNKGFSSDEVQKVDLFLDTMGVPREDAGPNAGLDQALTLIKQFEGCKLSAYPDPGSGGDPWTIGWGSTGPDIKRGVTWTQQQANDRLASDVAKFAGGVDALIKGVPTTAGQRAAMVSFAYNVGLRALQDSTLLKMHRAGDYEGAGMQFARWDKAAGKVLAGLTRRRAAEAGVYRS